MFRRHFRRHVHGILFVSVIVTALLFLGALITDYIAESRRGDGAGDKKLPTVGQVVPDFELIDASGKKRKLSDFRGSLIFLNFWATWCPPCVEEFEAMEALNQYFKTKNFVMLAVSVDDGWDEIHKFLAKRKVSFMVLHDPDQAVTVKAYGTTKFPETYVIDPEGRLLRKYAGAFNWTDSKKIQEFEGFLAASIKKVK